MRKKYVIFCVLSVLCIAIALGGWWFAAQYAAHKTADSHAAKNSHEGDHDEDHDSVSPQFSPQSLKNMGVEVAPAQLTTFVKYRTVPAVVAATPNTLQPVFAPVRGRIKEVKAEFGLLVTPEDVLVTIIRDALPRVHVTLTEDILKPAAEQFHHSLANFRRALKQVEILETELERLKQYAQKEGAEFPILPKKTLIDIRYELERAKQELSIARYELARHGLTPEQIAATQEERLPGIDVQIWYQALKLNGLWPPIAQDLLDALPKDMQKVHWTAVTLGELVASGLANEDLHSWLKRDAQVGKYFLEIGGLLQNGYTLEKIQSLSELHVFDPLVAVKPPGLAPDFDVHEILIKAGATVEAGTPLLILKNPRTLYLLAQPAGSEKSLVLQALQNNWELFASPLVSGVGPELTRLKFFTMVSDQEMGGVKAYIRVSNKPLPIATDHPGGQCRCCERCRCWELREGMQYTLKIPLQTMENVYVFPKEAVAEDGHDKVVFRQNGDTFKPIEVTVLYQDHEVVVVGTDSPISPGDAIAHQGAFALGLALRAVGEGKEEQGHEGHGH